MADFDNGLPPEGIDQQDGTISSFSYTDAELRQKDLVENEISSMSFSDEDYVKEDFDEQEITSMSFSVDETEKMNYVSMT